ncbi:hypothetical protein BU24DRAFT_133210 [Aaosphaeria arxii CBS 175.79]|uniref:Integral membrane protein n=1 Tax=Aaosphaeria arxii CBS 175.79 TaxID=1450172 RepID=A0A6A5Y4E3_9PLEO|nr:uncharacterized protein BU24DRAFT_133210 [Aaosphaeria arxii CBS 175.79]KAF2020073.1 hypothetical protein BU24DRAFT_133210 [Aaosphaeria arxii CBS 175.79]
MIGDSFFDRLARSKLLATKTVLLISATGGAFSFLLFAFTFVAAHNVPPMKAYWTADQTAEFWRKHVKGAHVAVGLQLCSGMFYIPFSALVSHNIRAVPGIHPIIATTQLAACSAGIFTWMLGAMVLATTTYRLDRDPEITQVMTDMWWFTTMMPWPTFFIQNWAWGYAIIKDTRPNRPFPRFVALINIIAPIIFILPTAMHTVKRGALSWQGGVSFWLLGLTFGVQLFVDSYCMASVVLRGKIDVTETNTGLNGKVEVANSSPESPV